MTNYTFFKTGAEWSPGSYLQFGLPIQTQGTQLTTFFGQPAVDENLFTSWAPDTTLIPTVIPGPGAKPGAGDVVNRVLLPPQGRKKRSKVENNIRNALTMIIATYYS